MNGCADRGLEPGGVILRRGEPGYPPRLAATADARRCCTYAGGNLRAQPIRKRPVSGACVLRHAEIDYVV